MDNFVKVSFSAVFDRPKEYYIILHERFDCGIYFCQITLLTFLGHPRGQWGKGGVPKKSKIAHCSKNDTQKQEICTDA